VSILVLFTILIALPAAAFDIGLTMQQSLDLAEPGDNPSVLSYTGSYAPWFSLALDDHTGLYLSAKLSTPYKSGLWRPESPPLLPELGRFEVSWRPRPNVYLEMGRVPFQDTLGIIASGLFDGLSGSIVMGKARISGGLLYTGFLYKETAKIVMTPSDLGAYGVPFDYEDFADSYFASRRIILSIAGEFTDLSPHSTLGINALAQYDLNSPASAYRLHTQYLSARFTFLPRETLTLSGGGVLGMGQNQDKDFYTHFALIAGVDWEVPGPQVDMLQGEFRWSSGAVNQGIQAFAPISAIPQGQVFSPRFSGLMTIRGKYSVRSSSTLSLSAEGTYFIRTDGLTLNGDDYLPSSSYLLGGEIYGSLLWAPVSDLMLNMGVGAFYPQLGDAFNKDAPIRWRLSIGLLFSL
jgi:hypothetical protein